jgi:putative ABC transport system permease protein
MDLGLDWRVLGFTTGLAVATCLLFGLAPAFRATRIAPATALKESAQSTTARASGFSLRRVLVASQVALSLTLLVGALLFAHSLNNLSTLQTGFRQNGILVADIDFSDLHLPTERRAAFSDELVRQVRAVPGVDAAARAAIVPLSGDGIGHDILPADSEPEGEAPIAAFNRVSPGFFNVMGTRMLAGRDFDDHDRPGSPSVAIVNETFAKKFLPDANPVGARFRFRSLSQITAVQVVGVVQDTKYLELREHQWPLVYTPSAQYERPGEGAQILIHSEAPLSSLIPAIKSITAQISPRAEVTFSPLRKSIENGMVRDRLMARLSGLFGGLAVVLAVIGLYGLISYNVARRRGEVGIRMVLGAQSSTVIQLLLREALLLLIIGLALGTGLALAAGRTVSSMLFGLKPTDVATFAAAWLLLSCVALIAAFLPAYRAAHSDPMSSLRAQ